MTAEIVAFAPPGAVSNDNAPAAQVSVAPSRLAGLAKTAGVSVLQGTVTVGRYTTYVTLFWLRGIVRAVLGLIGGACLIALIGAWIFMPADYESKNTALAVSASFGVGATVLRILFDKALHALAPEGAPV